jgi:hypothetical protein
MKQWETMKPTKTRPKTDAKKETHRGNSRRRPNSQITSQHKLEMVRRRARVTELAGEGKSVRAAEEILRSEGFTHCDHVTVAKDLKLEYQRLAEASKSTTEKNRERVYAHLVVLKDRLRDRGWGDPNYQSDLLSILNCEMKLLGLNADTRVAMIAANDDGIPPEKMIPWRRWLWETRHVPDSSLDQIWELCKKLSEPETPEALMNPPADSPLWHDDYEDDKGEPN